MASKSPAWQYFDKSGNGTAKCKKCSAMIKYQGVSTSGLRRHLHKHDVMLESSNSSSSSKQQKIGWTQEKLGFDRETKSLQEIVARLVAVDGISIHALCKSEYLRKSMSRDGMCLPRSPSTITEIINQYTDKVNHESIALLQERIQGERFCLVIEEWTSVRSRRFLNIQIHGKDLLQVCLGLIRITGTFTADRMLDCIRTHLMKYEIHLENHCIAIVSDGAAVMQRLGDLSQLFVQKCYAHAIHLAVSDAIYKHLNLNAQNVDEDANDSS